MFSFNKYYSRNTHYTHETPVRFCSVAAFLLPFPNRFGAKTVGVIAGEEFGQVFLTDTDEVYIREVLKGQEGKFEVVSV